MNKQEKAIYKDARPVGLYPMSNFGGLEVLDINSDFVICRFNFGTPDTLHRVRLNYGVNNTTFRVNGMTFKCSEIMRV